MNLLLLGHGKTGLLVEQIARERGHSVQVLTGKDNPNAIALTRERLHGVDAVIDFTNPEAVLANMRACIRERKPIVVGTTGWYEHLSQIEKEVKGKDGALLYGPNFSVGVNVFFEVVATAACAMGHEYVPTIVERHHTQKKDAPSGTAVSMQRIVLETACVKPEITSVREGETIGTHVLLLDSANDTMMLVHDAKNRRGFADGAVRAAEWLKGRKGLFEFRNIYREMKS